MKKNRYMYMYSWKKLVFEGLCIFFLLLPVIYDAFSSFNIYDT